MYDVIIVGARCSGSALGLLLARRGYRILMLDRDTFPSDHPTSTHILHQRAVACMARWGLRDQLVATNSTPFSRIKFTAGGTTLDVTAPIVDGEQYAFAPRRILLDQILLDEAIRCGVEFREGCLVNEVLFEDGKAVGVQGKTANGTIFSEKARLIVGADGSASRIAKAVQAEEYNTKPALQGTAWMYWDNMNQDHAEIITATNEAVAIFPSNGTLLVCNWAIDKFPEMRKDPKANYLATIARVAPHISEALQSATEIEEKVYLGSNRNFFRKSHGPGWALLGDSHYTKDPITAHGITDAFSGAEQLSGFIEEGLSGKRPLDEALEAYEQQRVAWAMPFYEITTQTAALQPMPPDALGLLAVLQHNPEAASRYIGMLTQAVSPVEFFSPENMASIFAPPA